MIKLVKKIFSYQPIRFLFVGGLNTLVGYGVYALLIYMGVNYLLANTISTIIGVAHSYLWNRFFTFKSKNKAIKEITKFVSVYVVSYLIGMCTLFIFKDKLNISAYLAGLINLVITTLISYFGHKYYSFKKEDNDKTIDKRLIIETLVIVLASFLLLLTFKNNMEFCDECDNMLGGMTIARGGHIYGEFPSQHTPLMYYIMSVFSFIGIKGVVGLRIAFYGLLSLIFGFIYYRYSKHVGKLPIILYVLLGILNYANYMLSYSITSEQLQSQALVIIFLELLLFIKNKKLLKHSELIICLSIFASVWVAVVSVIPCLFAILIFLIFDIKYYYEDNKTIKKYLKHFFIDYKKILIYGFLPFIIALLIIFITGNFSNFMYQAYYLNTEVYSKYTGYTSNIFNTIITTFINYFKFIINEGRTISNYHFAIINVSILLFNLIALVINFRKNKLASILLFIFVVVCGNRAFVGFHGLPFMMVTFINFTLAIYTIKNKKILWAIIILVLSLFSVKFIRNVFRHNVISENNYDLTMKLTKDNNYVYFDNMDTCGYVNTGLLPASKFTTLVPWFQEKYEKDVIKELKKNKPNVIYFEPNDDVWGHEYGDFSKKLYNYIKENYIYFSSHHFWVLKTYEKEAEKISKEKIPEYTNTLYKTTDIIPIKDNALEEVFIANTDHLKTIEIGIIYYARVNDSIIKISILDKDNNELYSEEMNTKNINENILLKKDVNLDINKNEEYKLKIEPIKTDENNYIGVNVKLSNDTDDYLLISGEKQENDLEYSLYYE